MTTATGNLLESWLTRALDSDGSAWLSDQLHTLSTDPSDRVLHVALGMAPRKLGRADLALSADDLAAAAAARSGWDPRGWSVADAARIRFVIQVADRDGFAARFTDLCRLADVSEAVALYRGLPLYPGAELLEDQAAEGVRTNMRAIFEAVAHCSPYPRELFDEDRWNQMVLKALFIGSALHPIQGLDERANASLAGIMCDYAHERWAAGRRVSPELWRCVGPFATGSAVQDLKRVLESDDANEHRAGVLALSASDDPDARGLLGGASDLAAEVESGALTWDKLAASL